MRTTQNKLILIVALVSIPLFNVKSQTKQTMQSANFTTEQSNVLNAILDMTNAFHRKDMERVMASYESKAVIVFEPGKSVSDPAAIREGFQGFFAVNPTFEYFGHEVFINEDLAMHLAPWKMTGTTPDGQAIQQSGLSVAILRKQPDGKWLMVFDDPFGGQLLGNLPK